MFTPDQLKILNDALDQALASNKRMQASKPKFAAIFQSEAADILALKVLINKPVTIDADGRTRK